jgi:hypothetical protein
MLEEGSFYGRTMDYAWMLFLSAISLLVSTQENYEGRTYNLRATGLDPSLQRIRTDSYLALLYVIVFVAICGHALPWISFGVHVGVHMVQAQPLDPTEFSRSVCVHGTLSPLGAAWIHTFVEQPLSNG